MAGKLLIWRKQWSFYEEKRCGAGGEQRVNSVKANILVEVNSNTISQPILSPFCSTHLYKPSPWY
jgi:hypothetical protein